MRRLLTVVVLLGVVTVGDQQQRRPYKNDRVYKARYMAKYGAMVKKMQFESIGVPDFRVGAIVSKMKPGYGWNADEMGSYMEGDILMPRRRGPVKRQIPTFKWPGGIVYYRINGHFNGQQRAMIKAAMEEFHDKTCVRFRPWTGRQPHFVSIENKKTGCWSALGRAGGKQRLNLQTPGCTYQIGVPIHEFMHVLGIFHEHVRADRDDYVKIGWRNIEHGKEHNFERRSYSGLGEVYDYTSVMHYSSRVFSRNNLPTIYPKLDTERLIGQRNGFSDSDLAKVNRLYDCYDKISSLYTNNLFSNELSIPDYSDFSKFVTTPLFPHDDVSTEDEELENIRETIKKKNIKKPWRPPGGYKHEEYRPRKPPRSPRKRPYNCRYGAYCGPGYSTPPWLTKYIYSYVSGK